MIKIFAIIPALAFSLILIPAYADIVTLSMEESTYTNDDMITFVGKETEGKKSVFVIIRDPVGDFVGIVSDPASDNNGNFVTIPRSVSLFFKSTGIYTATAFTSDQTEEEGLTINLRYDGSKVTSFKGHNSPKPPQNSSSSSTICDGELSFDTIEGELIVPDNKTCKLDRITVNGDVIVGKNSTFISDEIYRNVEINGNLKSNSSFEIHLRDIIINGNIHVQKISSLTLESSAVNGDILIQNSKDGFYHVILFANTINGNTAIMKNNSNLNVFVYNNVKGDLTFNNNETFSGLGIATNKIEGSFKVINNSNSNPNAEFTLIEDNLIGKSAICKNNQPQVGDRGSPNTYKGKNNGCP